MTVPFPLLLVCLAGLAATGFTASLVVGPAALTWATSLDALLGGDNEAARLVMQEIRLPRAILGAMIGATLGLSGAALQGYLRNPLADPGILGISSTAALGAVLAIYSGLSTTSPIALPLMAMGGAGIAVVVLRALAGPNAGTLTLILAGVAISSVAGAATTLALNLSSNPFAALEIVFWMLGSLTDRSMVHVVLAAPFMLIGWVLLLLAWRGLDALTLGPAVAATLGVSPTRTQALVVAGSAMAVGAATAVAGAIGFIGLVVPHLLRPLVGAQPSRLLPASALGGATLVLAADIAVRVIAPSRDIKLGVLTALIGAPFFLWLVIRTRREAL
ncbi:MAG: iron chelate uptake ABC transporter family permease subunit [Rhizobiales bacterium]|nr:iron chelate uptake ABC transporter family permease subunit [Hyphomicrobiales bacterium]